MSIENGDKVLVGNLKLTVKNIREFPVKTIRSGIVTYRKLYFLESHAPMWEYDIHTYYKPNGEECRK